MLYVEKNLEQLILLPDDQSTSAQAGVLSFHHYSEVQLWACEKIEKTTTNAQKIIDCLFVCG